MNSNYYNIVTDKDKFSKSLRYVLKNVNSRPLVILCIGTDKCSGDSLGPLIGYKLLQGLNKCYHSYQIDIYGTLANPVHALNLWDTIQKIYARYPDAYILAIDASLGQAEHVGMVTLGEGPLKPGLGVNKDLPQVGDTHITGIVNSHSSNDTSILLSTRLNTVMLLADFICLGITNCIYDHHFFRTKKRFLA